MGSQLVAIQQVKGLIDDGVRRFREEGGFGESGVWVVIELSRGFGLGVLSAQFPNGLKNVLLGQQPLLFQHLDQRCDFPHAGNGEVFKGDKVVGVERVRHEGGWDTGLGGLRNGGRQAKPWSLGTARAFVGIGRGNHPEGQKTQTASLSHW